MPTANWSPEDESSLPTLEEHVIATAAITAMKEQKEKLLDELELLEKGIQRLTVWMAPIRRVPAEILSEFFVQTCRDDWMAPLTLGAVCGRWRSVLIGTPRAWAFLDISPNSPHFHHELLDLWLSRCGVIKLHISMHPGASPAAVEVVCRHSRNLRCLSFFNNSKLLFGKFPELETLRLGPEEAFIDDEEIDDQRRDDIRKSEFTMPSTKDKAKKKAHLFSEKRFPKLVSLHLHSISDELLDLIGRKSKFPPLQELHINSWSKYLRRIVHSCAGSLVKLILELETDDLEEWPDNTTPYPINLPLLKYLHYVTRGPDFDDQTRLTWLITPNLETYHETNRHINEARIIPLHHDVSSITSLILENAGVVNWSYFHNVIDFELIGDPRTISNHIENLEANGNLCPKLASVKCIDTEWYDDEETSALLRLEKHLIRQSIEVQYTAPDFPGRCHWSCYTYCAEVLKSRRAFDYYGEEIDSDVDTEDDDDDLWDSDE